MRSVSGFLSVVVILLLIATACTKQPSTPDTPRQLPVKQKPVHGISLISKAELKEVEGVFNKKPTKRYDYRVIKIQKQKQGSRELIVAKKDDIRGLLLMRNKKYFEPLGGTFYDDQQGNLLRFGGKKKIFTMTYMVSGQNISAVDGNRDGIVDTAIGDINTGTFWIISDDITSLLPCLSASGRGIKDAALECTKPYLPDAPGGSGGDSESPSSSLDALGKPDCRPKQPGSEVGVGGDPATPDGEDPADSPPPPDTESPEDDTYPPMGRHEFLETNPEGGPPTRIVTIRTPEKLIVQMTGTTADGSVIRTTIHRDSQGRETYREDILVGPAPDRVLLMHRVRTTTYDADGNPTNTILVSRQSRRGLPPINPDGSTVFEDPRCAGRETKVSQGLGFLELCAQQAEDGSPTGSGDFLACYRQLENPLYNLSGGRCTKGPGPAGGQVINCSGPGSIAECISAGRPPAECAQTEPGGNLPVSPGGSGAGPTDAPGLPGSRGSIDIKYIDTIPLGAVFAGICSRGGCPDPEPF